MVELVIVVDLVILLSYIGCTSVGESENGENSMR